MLNTLFLLLDILVAILVLIIGIENPNTVWAARLVKNKNLDKR